MQKSSAFFDDDSTDVSSATAPSEDWSDTDTDATDDDQGAQDTMANLSSQMADMRVADDDVDMARTPAANDDSDMATRLQSPSDAPADGPRLFKSQRVEMAVHEMLTHLQKWWSESAKLLTRMAQNDLPCDTIQKLSDDIDHTLDKSIQVLIDSADDTNDPALFPIATLSAAVRTLRKVIFLKVGQVCCKNGNQDKCARVAKKALATLDAFKGAAADVYDTMIADLIDKLNSQAEADVTQAEALMTTPELQQVLAALGTMDPKSRPKSRPKSA
jgi:hypothetical protein